MRRFCVNILRWAIGLGMGETAFEQQSELQESGALAIFTFLNQITSPHKLGSVGLCGVAIRDRNVAPLHGIARAGGNLEVLTASAKSIRGGDADILSIDEAVLVPQRLLDAAWPLVRASRHPKRIVMSTASPDVSLEWFVRLLGQIAERTGQVWGSQLVDNALVNPNDQAQYPLPANDPLTQKWTALDWGFVGQAVLTFWEMQGDTLYLRDCRIWTETSYTEIKQEIAADFGKYRIYPDSEAVADNQDLTNMGMKVRPVIFSKEKDELISRVRWHLEKGLIKIPNPEQDQRYFTLVQQMKAYHYNEKTGKPVKVNDHCCDSVICAMKPFYDPEAYPRGRKPITRSF
jgi:hypothetical protein